MRTQWEDMLGALLVLVLYPIVWLLSIAWIAILIWGTIKVVGWLVSL